MVNSPPDIGTISKLTSVFGIDALYGFMSD